MTSKLVFVLFATAVGTVFCLPATVTKPEQAPPGYTGWYMGTQLAYDSAGNEYLVDCPGNGNYIKPRFLCPKSNGPDANSPIVQEKFTFTGDNKCSISPAAPEVVSYDSITARDMCNWIMYNDYISGRFPEGCYSREAFVSKGVGRFRRDGSGYLECTIT